MYSFPITKQRILCNSDNDILMTTDGQFETMHIQKAVHHKTNFIVLGYRYSKKI